MGIHNKTESALQSLKDTLEVCPHIETVHFTRTGEHFFNVTGLEVKGKSNGKLYGFLRQRPEVSKVVGERKIFKNVSVPTPEAEITESLSAQDVLDYEFGSKSSTSKRPVPGEGAGESGTKKGKGKGAKAAEAVPGEGAGDGE